MYGIYINGTKYPVAPSSITTKIANKNYTHDLINGEEKTVVCKPGLIEISFDLLLPNTLYPFAEYENNKFKPASDYLEELYQIKNTKQYISLLIVRKDINNHYFFDSGFDATLEDIEIKDDSEEGNDIIVSLSFKEFLINDIRTILPIANTDEILQSYEIFKGTNQNKQISKTFTTSSNTVDKKALETETRAVKSKIPNIKDVVQNLTKGIYNSKEFDSLTKIAKEVYGDAKEWISIYEENKAIIDSYASQLGLSKYIVTPDLPLKIPNMPIGVKRWLTK